MSSANDSDRTQIGGSAPGGAGGSAGGNPMFPPPNDLFGGPAPANPPYTPPPPSQPGSAPGGGGRAPGSTLVPGTVLNNTHRIESLVARGGMGEVYRATNTITGDATAIKTMRPELAGDPKIVELFRREAIALRKLRHPAIVNLEGIYSDDSGALYLAMEWLDGEPLSKVITSRVLNPAEVRSLRGRIASGLAAAHHEGVVHRDLSPDNVFLVQGSLDKAKLIDFGIAKQADPGKSTMIGTDFAGKYGYVAPEQLGMFGGHVDGKSDVYALGLVLATAAGAGLDMGNNPGAAVQARQKVPDLSRLPAELRGEIGRMLEPDPTKRPAMESFAVEPRTVRGPQPAGTSGGGGGSKLPLVAGIVAVLLLAGGGGGGYWLSLIHI